MITSSRSFEHRAHAMRRDHLLPVERETPASALARATWTDLLALTLFAMAFVGLVIAGGVFG